MMNFDERAASLYLATEVIIERRRRGQPIPTWMSQYHAYLDAEIRGVSRSRHDSAEIDGNAGQSVQENLIGASDVARILGWSVRKVQRRKADLGGVFIAGRLVFDRTQVLRTRKEIVDA